MAYEFSFASFIYGFVIFGAGAALMIWHQPIADNLASGVSSYGRFKFWAVITLIVGFLVMLNLHWFILGSLLTSIFHPIS